MDLRSSGYTMTGSTEESFKHANYEMSSTRRFLSENEYLRERVKSCERGLISLYQLLVQQDDDVTSRSQPRSLGQHRSASQVQLYRPVPTPHVPHPEAGRGGRGEDVGASKPVTVPSVSEIKELILHVVKDRSELLSHVEDLHRITEAAKRERILAIEEKDQLLHSTHLLKMALERKDANLKQLEEKREELLGRCGELQTELLSLQRTNEEAQQTRSLALEERTKVIEERNQLKSELCELQGERDRLFDEKVQLKGCVQELTSQGRQLMAELERTRTRFVKMEALACNLKEHADGVNGKGEVISVRMERKSLSQPWGFSIEGGVNSELFCGDPSIFITGIAEGSPASKQLVLGDKIVSVEGHTFTPIDRKQATEILKSCDQTSFVMEIARAGSKKKPQTLQVHIPGRKVFGFTYESRLFVSRVDQYGAAADLLWSGDEIVQVMGKPALNMKPSHLKQVLKSSKGGITLTVHRPPRGTSHCTLPIADQSEYFTKATETIPSPGTPGSGASDSSMGYSSSHSLPSVFSTPGPPVAKGNKEGNESIGERSQTASHSTGYDTDMSHYQRPTSVCSLAIIGTTGSSRHMVAGSPALTLYRGSSQSSQNALGGQPLPPGSSTPPIHLSTKNTSDHPGSGLHFSTRQSATPTLRTPGDQSSSFRASEEQNLHKPPAEQQQQTPREQQTCL